MGMRLFEFAESLKFDLQNQFREIEDLLCSPVGAVVAITQPWLLAPQSMQALQAGKHVYSSLAEDRHPLVNPWETARYMACGVMAGKYALREGEPLDVPDWGNAPE